MPPPTLLLARLDAIAASLAASGHALGLIALGSSGAEQSRLDAYSNLDFFAVVAPGHKALTPGPSPVRGGVTFL